MDGPRFIGGPGEAPPVGSFRRDARSAGMILFGGQTQMPPRIMGSDPFEVAANPPRQRSGANSGVYTVSLHDLEARRRNTLAGARIPVPVIGRIAAGRYDASITYHDYLDYERPIELERALLHADAGVYALRVTGTSMTHVGINDGDYVVIHPQSTADDGDFVVATLADSRDPEGYVTLKRFYHRKNHIFLQSATADKDPIRLFPQAAGRGPDRDQVKIQGKVLVVIRAGT